MSWGECFVSCERRRRSTAFVVAAGMAWRRAEDIFAASNAPEEADEPRQRDEARDDAEHDPEQLPEDEEEVERLVLLPVGVRPLGELADRRARAAGKVRNAGADAAAVPAAAAAAAAGPTARGHLLRRHDDDVYVFYVSPLRSCS